MNHYNPPALPCVSFTRIYERNIEPQIKNIDIFLKATTPPYKPKEVSDLLHIELNELLSIMKTESISNLDMLSFFTIVQVSRSYICQLIQREWKYIGIKYYTPEMIAYIYDLNIDKVRFAFEKSGLCYVDPDNIKELFQHINVMVGTVSIL